jgi:hypothetical protein
VALRPERLRYNFSLWGAGSRLSHTITIAPESKPVRPEHCAVKFLICVALLAALSSLTSCGAAPPSTAITCTTTSTSTSTPESACLDPVTGIYVTIAPATVSLNIVTSYQFLASVSGTTDTVITWQVNGTPGGDDTVGRIDSNGLYHSPSTVPSPATVSVTAVAYDEPAVTATSAVTIIAAPTVTISPTSLTMTSGTAKTQTFTSTVTGAATTNVDWYVGNAQGKVQGGNSTFGTIDSNGVYSAPATPPIGSSVIVTVVSRDFPLSSASATVTLSGYSTSSLQGHFAFSVSGQILSGVSAGPFYRAGSFIADGAGNLIGGLEDINESSGVTSGYSFVGTYTVSADGRGLLNFADAQGPANLPAIFDFVLVNGAQLQIMGFDASGTPTYSGTAAGQASSQDLTAFTNNSNSALMGTYVFDFSGTHGVNALSMIGEFAADGAGDITSGSMDINDGGTANPSNPFQITGNTAPPLTAPVYPSFYSINSNGRGTLTLATNDPTFPKLTFSVYVVSRGLAEFVETDTAQAVAGATLQQAPNTTFDQTVLDGSYAFLLTGSGTGGTLATATAGSFIADGNGLFTSGLLDENISGTPDQNVAFSGSYTVTSNGRGTATFTGARTYVFYLGPTGSAVFQETDTIHPNIAVDGILARQQSAAFTLASFQGNYAISANGLSGTSAQVITGQLGSDGAGLVPSGAIDINTAGTLTSGETVSGSYLTPASTGRSALTLNPLTDNRNFAVYVVNSAQVFIVGIDSGRLASGNLLRQY